MSDERVTRFERGQSMTLVLGDDGCTYWVPTESLPKPEPSGATITVTRVDRDAGTLTVDPSDD